MAEVERILDIRINYGDAIKKIAEYKEAVAQVTGEEEKLKRQLEEGEVTQQEYLESTAALKIEKKQYTDAIRVLNKEVDNELKKNRESEGSLKALRAELSNLTKAYDEMSREEREGAAGEELQKHIMQISSEIKNAEYNTNRFYRNVGNYPKEVIGMMRDTYLATGSLKKGFEAGATSVAGFGKQLLKLLANPIVALFAAIAAVVLKVVNVFKNSEERTNKMRLAMAKLEPIVNAVNNLFGKLADFVAFLVEKIMDFVEAVVGAINILGDYIGIHIEYNRTVEKTIELEKARQEQIERQRKFLVEEAEAERDVAKLRDNIAQKDKFNIKDRLAMLDTAIRIEEGIAQKRVDIAKERLRILDEEKDLTENAAEMNQKLAEAKRAVVEAEASQYETTRRLQQQRSSLIEEDRKEQEAKRKAAADEAKRRAEEAKKRREEQIRQREAMDKAEKDAIRKAEDELNKLIADIYERQYTQTKTQYQREIDALRERLATEKNLTEAARAAISQTIIAKQQQMYNELQKMESDHAKAMQDAADAEYNARVEDNQKRIQSLQDAIMEQKNAYEEYVKLQKELAEQEAADQQEKMDAIASVFGNLSSLMEQFGENNKAMAKLSKILALGEIAVNTGKAIAAGVAQAQSVPFPGNIAAIATTVATILANVTSAISTVKSAKFARGGTVTGPGTGTSDSISARLSNGESVNTALATSMFGPMYSAMNQMAGGSPITGGGMSNMGEAMLARAFAAGASMIPAPRVSVEEVTSVQNRVQTLESLATV